MQQQVNNYMVKIFAVKLACYFIFLFVCFCICFILTIKNNRLALTMH